MAIERTGHAKNCEKAEKPPCACACGGAEHGWQEGLAIAAAPSDSGLRKLVRAADAAWDAAAKEAADSTARRSKPWQQAVNGQRAAIKSFVADVVRWLRRDRNLYSATEEVGQPFRISRDKDPEDPRRRPTPEEKEQFVETHVIPRLRREFGDRHIDTFQKKARNAHFWCELLAQTARALDAFQNRYDQAKQDVVAALTSLDESRPDGWAALLPEQVVIRQAVELVFEHLPRAATGGIAVEDAFRLVWPARVLAVLMCREPRRHPAVLEYCVRPIVDYGTAEIREQVKDRLRQAFPLYWSEPPGGAPGGPA
ncbi:hypothetical protein [Spirillospora sp. NPDC029432]|uniref:hypothetical protein n=1 Tax=Spirillospora sp. NPDC029432 TaxID=3154599 RepID=UPI0034573633